MRGPLVSVLWIAAVACSDSPSRTADPDHAPEEIAIDEDLTVAQLLSLLSRPHAEAAASLGPHVFRYRATTTLGEGDDAREIVDEVLLRHVPGQHGADMELEQTNSAGRGRHVIVVGETLHARVLPRPFLTTPVESDIHQTFVEEVWDAPADILSLAAPRLAISPGPEKGGQRVITLTSGPPAPTLRPPIGSWRAEATVTAVEGTLTLTTEPPVPVAFDITVTYELRTDAGPVPGRAHLVGSTRKAGDTLRIEPPKPDQIHPTPVNQTRLEPVRRRLLDGLAAPGGGQ